MKILFIPSGGITPVNQLKSDTLSRLQVGMRYWNSNEYKFILVTGGCFLPQSVQTEPAAKLMQQWLVEHGVDPRRIIVEDKSLDTFENVKCGLSRLNQSGVKDPEIYVVTQRQHALRFSLTFRAYGVRLEALPFQYHLGLLGSIFECAFFFVHLLDPRGQGFVPRMIRRRRQAAAGSR